MDLVFEFYLHFYWHFLSFPFDLIPATLVRVLTPSVSPNEKTFKVVLVCCSCDPSLHPPSIFGGFSGSFASVCSRPLGVPVTSPLFLASFEHFLHLFVFSSSCHSLFLHYSFPPEIAMQSCPQLFKGRALKVHDNIPPHSYCLYPDRPPADSHP